MRYIPKRDKRENADLTDILPRPHSAQNKKKNETYKYILL